MQSTRCGAQSRRLRADAGQIILTRRIDGKNKRQQVRGICLGPVAFYYPEEMAGAMRIPAPD